MSADIPHRMLSSQGEFQDALRAAFEQAASEAVADPVFEAALRIDRVQLCTRVAGQHGNARQRPEVGEHVGGAERVIVEPAAVINA